MPGLIASANFYSFLAKGFIRLQLFASAHTDAEKTVLREEMAAFTAEADKAIDAYRGTITQEEDRALFAKLETARTGYREIRAEFLRAAESARTAELDSILRNRLMPSYRAYAAAAEAMLAYNAKNGETLGNGIAERSSDTVRTLLIVTGAALLLAVAVTAVMVRTTNRRLGEVSHQLSAGADQTAASAGRRPVVGPAGDDPAGVEGRGRPRPPSRPRCRRRDGGLCGRGRRKLRRGVARRGAGRYCFLRGAGLSSRLAARSASVTVETTPPAGTSRPASQTRALRTRRRWSSCFQLAW